MAVPSGTHDTGGWVALHRRLADHPLNTQLPAEWFKVWANVLMRANWKPTKWWDGEREIDLPPGSFVGSSYTLAATCRVSRGVLLRCMRYLVRVNMVTQHANSRYTVYVVNNWDTYQNPDEVRDTLADYRRSNDDLMAIQTRNANETQTDTEEQRTKNKEQERNGHKTQTEGESAEVEEFRLDGDVARQPRNLLARQRVWFGEWWAGYWRKVQKKAAWAAFQKNIKTEEHFSRVISRRDEQLPEMMSRNVQHRPHGATWLNGEDFETEDIIAEPKPTVPVLKCSFCCDTGEVLPRREDYESNSEWADAPKQICQCRKARAS